MRLLDGAMRKAVVGDLEQIARAEWDRLAAEAGFYLSYGWLRATHGEPFARTYYVVAHDGGDLVGALPVFDVEAEGSAFYAPERHHRVLTGGSRWLLAGSRRGYHNGVLLSGDEAGRARILRGLLDRALKIAADRGARGLVWMFAPTATAAELHAAGGSVAFDTVEACLAATSWDGYLAELTGRRRRNTLRERRRFEEAGDRAGYHVSEQPLSECWTQLAALVANVQNKYGHRTTPRQMHRALERQVRFLDDESVAFTVRRRGEMVAAALRYRFGDTLYARMVGFEYESLANAYEYFNLAYYLPIHYMQRRGLRRLHLGIEAADVKVERGARLHPLWTVAVPCDGSALTPTFQAKADEKGWRERYDDRVLPPAHWNVPW